MIKRAVFSLMFLLSSFYLFLGVFLGKGSNFPIGSRSVYFEYLYLLLVLFMYLFVPLFCSLFLYFFKKNSMKIDSYSVFWGFTFFMSLMFLYPLIWLLFGGQTLRIVGYDICGLFFMWVERTFLLSMIPAVLIAFNGILRFISRCKRESAAPSLLLQMPISFALSSLVAFCLMGALQLYICTALQIIKISANLDRISPLAKFYAFGVFEHGSSRIAPVLLRTFVCLIPNMSQLRYSLTFLFVGVLMFPLINTIALEFYKRGFIQSDTTQRPIARFYFWVWMLGNIAFFPLTTKFISVILLIDMLYLTPLPPLL